MPLIRSTFCRARTPPRRFPAPGRHRSTVSPISSRRLERKERCFNPVPPNQEPPGEYWSPYADAGRFGGGGILEWLRNAICAFLSWIGLPCSANT